MAFQGGFEDDGYGYEDQGAMPGKCWSRGASAVLLRSPSRSCRERHRVCRRHRR